MGKDIDLNVNGLPKLAWFYYHIPVPDLESGPIHCGSYLAERFPEQIFQKLTGNFDNNHMWGLYVTGV